MREGSLGRVPPLLNFVLETFICSRFHERCEKQVASIWKTGELSHHTPNLNQNKNTSGHLHNLSKSNHPFSLYLDRIAKDHQTPAYYQLLGYPPLQQALILPFIGERCSRSLTLLVKQIRSEYLEDVWGTMIYLLAGQKRIGSLGRDIIQGRACNP